MRKKIREQNLKPVLAVILVGEKEESKLYINLKKRAGKEIGVKVSLTKFKGTAREEKIIKRINALNQDRSISGIIVQLPLPGKLLPEKILGAICPKKDVDGFHSSFLSPVLPQAILFALKDAAGGIKNIERKRVVALVNSHFFGNALKAFCEKEK